MKTVTLLILTSLLFAFASYGGGTSSCCLAVAAGDSPGLAVWELTNGIANEGAGIVYVADADGDSTRAAVVSTLDGAASRRLGGIDATGAEASFTHPSGVAADGAGNIYVADFYGYTVRKITRAGEVSTLAGATGLRGSTDAAGAAARFSGPRGVAIDSAGNVYVADANNSTIRKITSAGEVSTFAGAADSFPGNTDATGAAARFFAPEGIAIDSADNLYVADTNNNTIRKITPVRVVTTFAGSTEGRAGTADGTGAAARFFHPEGVAIDRAGNLYVADRLNYTIRKITPAGVVTTLAGRAGRPGSADGTRGARFNHPEGVATDIAGNVYVADTYNHTIRKITPAGEVTTLAGTADRYGSIDATGAAARFTAPLGVATDGAGNVYVADGGNSTVRKITPAGAVRTLAGTGRFAVKTNVAAASFAPWGVATDSAGNVYVADTYNSTIRKITPAGEVTALDGTAGFSHRADATANAECIHVPHGVATDGASNIYVADFRGHTVCKITPAGEVSTLAGTAGVSGNTDATGTAARFGAPEGVATDSAGNVYVADRANHTIRKITPAGEVSTLAGTAGVSGNTDATGAAARFRAPEGVATDSAGNVYVADRGNHTIRKITPAGEVSTLAGTAGVSGNTDATGTAARFDAPWGVATDNAGNVYVADTYNHAIRKITPAGEVNTLAGTAGVSGNVDAAGTAAQFDNPLGVATDSAGNVYVADHYNSAIRRITPVAGVAR